MQMLKKHLVLVVVMALLMLLLPLISHNYQYINCKQLGNKWNKYEIQHLANSFAQLRAAQSKFTESIQVLTPVEGKSGQEILVPLTSSLYVPGEIGESDKVIVDVGTGYFVEQKIPDARAFYKRKVELLKARLDELQATITDRRNSHAVLIDIIRSKLYALSQDQKGRRSASQAQAVAAS